MKTINVEGLPEPLARGFQMLVKVTRDLMGTPSKKRAQVTLHPRPGTVFRPIDRDVIYGDEGDDNA